MDTLTKKRPGGNLKQIRPATLSSCDRQTVSHMTRFLFHPRSKTAAVAIEKFIAFAETAPFTKWLRGVLVDRGMWIA
jgi:hypothetical protein